MKRPKGNRDGESGFGMIDVLLSLGGMVLLAVAAAFLVSGIAHDIDGTVVAEAASSHATEVWRALAVEAHASEAVWVPANDVTGASNADGHEVDLYAKDVQRNPHFWAWNFRAGVNGAPGTLTKYAYTGMTSSGSPVGVMTAATVSGITAFAATTETASWIAQNVPWIKARLGSVASTVRDVSVNLGYPGVNSANALVMVDFAAGSDKREVGMLPAVHQTRLAAVVGYFAPSPPPPPAATPPPPAAASPPPPQYGCPPGMIGTVEPNCTPTPAPSADPPTPFPSPSTPSPTPVPSVNLGTIYVDETWYTSQYKPCRIGQTYVSYTTATTGTLGQVASGSVPIASAPNGDPAWMTDVEITAQNLINRGDPPSDTATFVYRIQHVCQDLALP